MKEGFVRVECERKVTEEDDRFTYEGIHTEDGTVVMKAEQYFDDMEELDKDWRRRVGKFINRVISDGGTLVSYTGTKITVDIKKETVEKHAEVMEREKDDNKCKTFSIDDDDNKGRSENPFDKFRKKKDSKKVGLSAIAVKVAVVQHALTNKFGVSVWANEDIVRNPTDEFEKVEDAVTEYNNDEDELYRIQQKLSDDYGIEISINRLKVPESPEKLKYLNRPAKDNIECCDGAALMDTKTGTVMPVKKGTVETKEIADFIDKVKKAHDNLEKPEKKEEKPKDKNFLVDLPVNYRPELN